MLVCVLSVREKSLSVTLTAVVGIEQEACTDCCSAYSSFGDESIKVLMEQ
jgi:hypothetical protein